MEKFNTDFDKFWDKIEKGENFAFARYADGEVMLMNGNAVNHLTQAALVDKWTAPLGMTKVGSDLLETLNHTESNYYYAISAPTDNLSDYNYLKSVIKTSDDNITFVNLWINSNYQRSLERYKSLSIPVNLICNYNAKKENFPFKIQNFVMFPDNCITFWAISGDAFIEGMKEMFGSRKNELFFISCGPVSEIIIHKLYEFNPNNIYVDVGSSIDEFIHGKKTRPYMEPTSQYGQMISRF